MIGMIPYFICFVLLAAVFVLLPRRHATRKAAVILLVLSFLGDLLICNFHSFHLLGGEYPYTRLDLTGENVTLRGGITNDPLSVPKGGTLTLEVSEPDMPVGTVRIELLPVRDAAGAPVAELPASVSVSISAKDATHSGSYRVNVADGEVIRGDERSSYVVLDLSGNVEDLKIAIRAPSGERFTLGGITLNERIPLQFSALRLMLLVLGGMAVYALLTAPSMKKTHGEAPAPLQRTALVLTVLLVLGGFLLTRVSMLDHTGDVTTGWRNTHGNQITQSIVDAFRAGQTYLTEEPPRELLELENPYDWSQREHLDVDYRWDNLLYEGKYYSYYGIAPVLLLYLPYNLLTGYYFPSAESIFLFGGLGIIFLTLLFLEFAKLFGKKIPNSMLIATLVVLQVSSGVWFNFANDNFYEIAQASGFMFTCAGFFFLLRSRIVGEGKVNHLHLTLATICLSWAVLCRPTLALYCIVACIFIVFGFIKRRGEVKEALPDAGAAQKKALRSATVKYLLAALTPFVLIGGIQVIYNVARFGNPLDFGIQYSLTINDFTRAEYHTDFVMVGFFNFLLVFPRIGPEFPYITSNYSDLSVNGYYFAANENAVGILWRALPSLGYLGVVPAWKALTKKERLGALCLLVPTCVIAPLVIIFSIWESGYGVRYCCDFAWQFILGGTAVLYLLYDRVAEGQGKTILRNAFTVAMVLGVVVNGAMLYEYLPKEGELTDAYLRLERIFDFWR